MRSNPHLTLIASLGSLLCSANALAVGPPASPDAAARWHRLGRTLGIGWSDGYHACVRRDHRLGDNLPPPSGWHHAAAFSAPQWPWPGVTGQPLGSLGPGSAPAPLPLSPLPPSVLQPSAPEGAKQVPGEPSDRVSRAGTVDRWKWVREPSATENR